MTNDTFSFTSWGENTHPSVSVDILPFTVQEGKLDILLIQRAFPPFKGAWALPGGFLYLTESAGEAAKRILQAKTEVSSAHFEQLYTFSRPDRDPRSRVISISYLALIPAPLLRFSSGGETMGAALFTPTGDGRLIHKGTEETLSQGDLAFDHGEILEAALLRMRGKVMYSDIALSLVSHPEGFTLPELQEVYEAILFSPLDAGNFYRRMKRDYIASGKIEATGETAKLPGKKPAALYRVVKGEE